MNNLQLLLNLCEENWDKDISNFKNKYPNVDLPKDIEDEMISQGYKINIINGTLIVETPYAEYEFKDNKLYKTKA